MASTTAQIMGIVARLSFAAYTMGALDAVGNKEQAKRERTRELRYRKKLLRALARNSRETTIGEPHE